VLTCQGAVHIAGSINTRAAGKLIVAYSRLKADNFASGTATGPGDEMHYREHQAKKAFAESGGGAALGGTGSNLPPIIEDWDEKKESDEEEDEDEKKESDEEEDEDEKKESDKEEDEDEEEEDSELGVVTKYLKNNFSGDAQLAKEYGKYANALKGHAITLKEASEIHTEAHNRFNLSAQMEINRNETKRLAAKELAKKQNEDNMQNLADRKVFLKTRLAIEDEDRYERIKREEEDADRRRRQKERDDKEAEVQRKNVSPILHH
jgi:hypothetical protein